MRQEALINMVLPLIKQRDEDTKVLPLRYLGDPVLEQSTEPIEQFDDPSERYQPLAHLATMLELARQHYGGVGLAAPQVGLSVRMAIVACEGVKVVMCNPRIETAHGKQRNMEGCLSIPRYTLNRDRFEQCTVKFQDVLGRESYIEAKGYLAQTIQHEVDHLNGVLFIDGFGRNVRRAAQRATNRYIRLAGIVQVL